MRTIAAGPFKAKCLAVPGEVKAKRKAVLITKNGKPVAQLVPVQAQKDSIFGFYAGKGKITGDIASPVMSPEDWTSL